MYKKFYIPVRSYPVQEAERHWIKTRNNDFNNYLNRKGQLQVPEILHAGAWKKCYIGDIPYQLFHKAGRKGLTKN
jgi:hypothetical protein